MSDVHAVAPGDGAAPAAPVVTPANDTAITASEAARNLSNRRWEKAREPKEENTEPLSAEPGEPAEQELSPQGDNADPPQEAPGETQATEPAEQLPPIEAPRSWTKDEQERFKTYPRELQAYLSEREQERDRDLRRRQNEAAELQKQTKAEQDAAAKARQEYEAAITQAIAAAQQQVAGEFADIRTWDDLERLRQTDFDRFTKFQVHQQKVQALQAEENAAKQRREQELSQQWQSFAAEQDRLAAELIPELSDPEKAPKIRESVVKHLEKVGADLSTVMSAWEGKHGISPRSAWFQKVLSNSLKYEEAKAAAAKPAPKPLPPVQRPGVAQPRGAAQDATIQALSQKLEQSGSIKDAAALIAARRAARR